ncbi:MAG: ribosomal-processing cysteine protease Prp [Clostridiaceae bacterium]|jgi:uncharacterized protein YsxB (DUF464 family)|nr:ribosomal-processing cysteine protease Prp [Clostridiaceae bacterium]
MIRIVISRNSAGSINSMKIDGHSGYAEEGSDIICSAVSVTAYTAAGALDELAGLKGCYSEGSGHMTIRLPDGLNAKQAETAAVIMETTAIGFKQIEHSYGRYVSVMDEEVQSDD